MYLGRKGGRFQKFFTLLSKVFYPTYTFGKVIFNFPYNDDSDHWKISTLLTSHTSHILSWDCTYEQFWVKKRSFFGYEREWKTSKFFFGISKLATQWMFPITWDYIRLHETSHRPPSLNPFYKNNFESWKMNFLVTKILYHDSSNIFPSILDKTFSSKMFFESSFDEIDHCV